MDLFTLSAKLSLDTDEYERKIKEAVGSANTFSSTFKAIVASDLFRNASDAMAQFASESIDVASSLNEVQNVVDVTFGKDSGKIDRWAKTANRSFGLTELQAKKFTSTLGAMMKSSGLAGDSVADMSMELAGLTADMSSFYNLDYDVAFEKIRSGISGETEPLKQLGINMSVANLEAFALAKGIEKSYSSMSQAEQVQLRYNYLMQATADAQGDFSRTSEGYANSVRILEGNIETLKGRLGEIVLPLLETAAGLGNQLLDALIPDVTLESEFDNIEKEYQDQLSQVYRTEADVSIYTSALAELEKNTSLTAEEQERWDEICRRLVQTLPSLNSVIDVQTGKVNGGTKAILEHAKAWREDAEDQAKTLALQDEYNALASAQKDLAKKDLDIQYAHGRAEEAERSRTEALQELAKAMNLPEDELSKYADWIALLGKYGLAGTQEFQTQAEAYAHWSSEVEKFTNEENRLINEHDEMVADLESKSERFAYLSGEIDSLGGSYDDLTNSILEQSKAEQQFISLYSAEEDALSSLEEQLASVDAYRKAMTESIRQQIDTVVSGFQGMGMDELSKNFDENLTSMVHGLQDQVKYMEDYAANLKKAAEMGVEEGLLATLADGSKESALYLQEIVSATEEGEILALNGAWLKAEEGKETFAQTLAAQQLSADEAYSAIEAKANEMVDNLDQAEQARLNAESTMAGLIDGLESQNGALDEQINSMNAKLRTLGLWTVGNIPRVSTMSTFSTSKNAHGLDYVPTDDYPAWLHKGEAVLTRNEAEGWRAIQNMPQSNPGVDTQALADVILSAMGGVTLQMDKQTVGQIITPVVSEEIAREARARRYDL